MWCASSELAMQQRLTCHGRHMEEAGWQLCRAILGQGRAEQLQTAAGPHGEKTETVGVLVAPVQGSSLPCEVKPSLYPAHLHEHCRQRTQ